MSLIGFVRIWMLINNVTVERHSLLLELNSQKVKEIMNVIFFQEKIKVILIIKL